MAELKIEVRNDGLVNDEQMFDTETIPPENINIKIFNDDQLVAETNLENLVKKFLIVSSQNMQMAAALEVIREAQEKKSNIVLPGDA